MENQWSNGPLSSLPFMQGDEAEGGLNLVVTPAVKDTAISQSTSPFDSNAEITWHNLDPCYPEYCLDGTVAWGSMLPMPAIGQANAVPFLPSSTRLINPRSSSFSLDGSSAAIANTVEIASTDAAAPFANNPAFVAYTPLPDLTARVLCVHPGCTKDFKRRSEMTRHYRQAHDPWGLKFGCFHDGCQRHGLKGFARKDKLRDHQRAAHGLAL